MKHRGFTLVELLVVIAIVGLLSGVAVVSTNAARSKARDTKRLADIKQIMSALYLYYDANGHYPDTGALGCAAGSLAAYCLGHGDSGTCWNLGATHGCTALDNALAPYMGKIPDDPGKAGTTGDAYIYHYDYTGGAFVSGGVTVYPPFLHWGMEQATNANVCFGGASGG